MKKSITILCILLCGYLKATPHTRPGTPPCSSSNAASINLVISCLVEENDLNRKIEHSIKNNAAITFIDYCPSHAVYLVKFEGQKSDCEQFLNELRNEYKINADKLFIKAEEFGDIINFCN